MAEHYARAIWELVLRGMTPKKAVQAVHERLIARGRAALMPHIAKALERLAARVSQKETIVLSIARKQDEHKTLAQAKSALAGLSASRDEIEVRIDETLIGGWRLEGGEHLVDASYKMQLLDMYTAATAR